MKADWKPQAETAGGKIEELLTSEFPFHKESGHQMKGWYKIMAGRTLLPAQLTIERITAERVELHHHIPTPGENIPVSVDPFPLDELVPMEDDIEWAVRRMWDNHSGGPSRIRAEHLQQWIWEAQKE